MHLCFLTLGSSLLTSCLLQVHLKDQKILLDGGGGIISDSREEGGREES